MLSLLLGIVLSVCTCWIHSMVTLPPWFVSTDFGTCSYQRFLSICTPISVHMLKCSCALTLSCRFTYCSFDNIGHADIIWSIASSYCWQSLHLLSVSVFNIYYYYLLRPICTVFTIIYLKQILFIGYKCYISVFVLFGQHVTKPELNQARLYLIPVLITWFVETLATSRRTAWSAHTL